MEKVYQSHQPLMNWVYAGPFAVDVSDIYTDNYIVPFHPYQAYWDSLIETVAQCTHVRENAAVTLFGQESTWKYLQTTEADTQLTWARFGRTATLLSTIAQTSLCLDEPAAFSLHIRLNGSAALFVDGAQIWKHQKVGRVELVEDIPLSLPKGEHIFTIAFFNVHLHCLNSVQLTLDIPMRTRTALADLPERVRIAAESCFHSLYLSDAVLLPGKTQFLSGTSFPEVGSVSFQLFSPGHQPLCEGTLTEERPSALLLEGTGDMASGKYTVSTTFTYQNVTVHNADLSFDVFRQLKNLPENAAYSARSHFLMDYYATHEVFDRQIQGAFSEIAKFASGHPERFSEQNIVNTLNYIDQRYDCSDFALHGVLRFYLLYADRPEVSDRLREKIRHTILHFKYWVDEPGRSLMFTRSENHEMLFYSIEYLAGLAFPDSIFANSGQNGLFHALKGRINAEHWIREKSHYGFTEWHSNTYYEEDMLALLDIYDFGEENGLLRQLARQLLDVIVLLVASNSKNGVMATTHGRCYENSLMYPQTEGMSRLNWMMFGKPKVISDSLSIGATALATSGYSLPENAEAIVAEAPLLTISRMGLFRSSGQQGVLCSTYRTRDYLVSGLIESKAGESGAQVQAGQILLGTDLPVFVTCFADRSPTTRPSYFGGQYRIPKTVARKNLLCHIYHITEKIGYTHCYFPQKQFDEVTEKNGWMFGKKGNAYIAVTCTSGFTVTKGGIYDRRELFSASKSGVWILEAGSAKENGSFSEFIDSIANAALHADGAEAVYESPSQGKVSLSWDTPCKIEEKPVRYSDGPLIDNKYVHSEFGSGKYLLQSGFVLDFFA